MKYVKKDQKQCNKKTNKIKKKQPEKNNLLVFLSMYLFNWQKKMIELVKNFGKLSLHFLKLALVFSSTLQWLLVLPRSLRYDLYASDSSGGLVSLLVIAY